MTKVTVSMCWHGTSIEKRVVVVLRSPIHANEPSEYNGMLYRTSNRVLNNGIKVIILICMDGTSQYHHHRKKSMVKSLSDLWFGVKGQRTIKSQTTSNGKSNSVSMLTLDRRPKLSMVTSSSDLWLRGQRSKKGQISNMLKWQK